MLEPDAFERMAGDDAPVAEGVFFVGLISLLVGVAQSAGSFLYTWAMPPAVAVEAVLSRLARSVEQVGGVDSATTLQLWQVVRYTGGFDTGWVRLYPIFWQPFVLLAQWVVAGLLLYLFARALGGVATLPSTLGATALVAAPHVLRIAEVAPFLQVPSVLLFVWGVLILYRAAQTVHGLPWQRAAATALISTALLWVIGALVVVLSWFVVGWVLP